MKTSEKELKRALEEYGSITSCSYSPCAGTATITYSTKEAADRAIKNANNTKVCGSIIKVGKKPLFEPLKEGLSTASLPTSSLKLTHLKVTSERKRSRDSMDDLPDYSEDEDDLPITKRSTIHSPEMKKPISFALSCSTVPASTTITTTTPAIIIRSKPNSTQNFVSAPLIVSKYSSTITSCKPSTSISKALSVKPYPHVKKRTDSQPISQKSVGTEHIKPCAPASLSHSTPLFTFREPVVTPSGHRPITRSTDNTFSFIVSSAAPTHSTPELGLVSFAQPTSHTTTSPSSTKHESGVLQKNSREAVLSRHKKVQHITESLHVTPLFILRESKAFAQIGGNCITVSSDNIIVTGEQHQVKVITNRLKNDFQCFNSKLKSEQVDIKAVYAPLFLEDGFLVKMHEICQRNLVEIKIIKQGTKEHITCEAMVSKLRDVKGNDELLTLNHLYKANLLHQEESLKQQWYIQTSNGQWDKVPHETNELFNNCAQKVLPVEDKGATYNVDLQNKTALDQKGFAYPMKCLDMEPTWYHEDDIFGSVSYSDEESRQIEKCYREKVSRPMSVFIDGTSRKCYYNFRSKLEVSLTKNSVRSIERDPPMILAFLSPAMKFVFNGYQSDIAQANKALQEFLQTKIKSHPFPPKGNKQVLECRIGQYCVDIIEQSLMGVSQYVAEVIVKEVVSSDAETGAFSLTSEVSFAVPPEWSPQEDDVNMNIILVQTGSEEWNFVQSRWNETMSLPMKRIERIQNKRLWQRYCFCREQLKDKNEGVDNEKWLFHGTKTTPPDSIYDSEKGFDFRLSRRGMWGEGSYFAQNASYSDHYSHNSSGNKQMFLACVLAGDSAKLSPKQDLKMPPKKPDGKYYDSVHGHTNGSIVYIVYEHGNSYPAYLITY